VLQSAVVCLSSLLKRIAQEELLLSCSVLFHGRKLSCQQSEALKFLWKKFLKLNEYTLREDNVFHHQ